MINRQNIRRQLPDIINYLFVLDSLNDPISRKIEKNDQLYFIDFTQKLHGI